MLTSQENDCGKVVKILFNFYILTRKEVVYSNEIITFLKNTLKIEQLINAYKIKNSFQKSRYKNRM